MFITLAGITASVCWGQLNTGQKVADFQTLASLYAKQYAPAQWKIQAFNYSLFKISSWVTQVQQTTNDLDFYQLMAEYVASLNDAHSVYINPSNFEADLGFSCDIYDGKVLIDYIDRSILPATKYPFQIGDQVMMVDSQTTDELIQSQSQFFSDANPRSTSRDAADLIPFRIQAYDPKAEAVGATATVVIQRQKGNLETYMIPWQKSGTPLSQIGPSQFPQIAGKHSRMAPMKNTPTGKPNIRQSLLYLQNMRLPVKKLILNFDALPPVFKLPQGFVQRLGNGADYFYSGTYKSGSKTIGYIRIPDFEASGDYFFVSDAEDQFDTEITYMQQNTDGLVVDVMRNPGGFGCYAEDLVSRLVTHPFHDLTGQIRPTIYDVQAYQAAVDEAILEEAPTWQIQVLKSQTNSVTKAYQQGGLTGALPLCGYSSTRQPNTDSHGKQAVYGKPILLLTDEFSASAADIFAAMFQDAKAGKTFGWRTMGAGGAVIDGNVAGYYSEGTASVTNTLITRQAPIVSADYPTAPFIENIGVAPDIQNDYMTKSNLLNGGKDFVSAFTTAILGMIGK